MLEGVGWVVNWGYAWGCCCVQPYHGLLQSIGCKPVAHVDDFKPEMLGHAELVEEVSAGDSKFIKVG